MIFNVPSSLATDFVHVVTVLCRRGSARVPTNFCDTEQRLPPLNDATVWRSGIAKAGRYQSTFSPSVVDTSDMPVNPVGRCIAVELVSDIDEDLNGCNVDIVDRREIKDDGLERGTIGMVDCRFAASRTRVVPRTILWAKLIHLNT